MKYTRRDRTLSYKKKKKILHCIGFSVFIKQNDLFQVSVSTSHNNYIYVYLAI